MYSFDNACPKRILSRPLVWALAALVTGSLAAWAQPSPGPVQLQSSPPGARVYLNGVYSGLTPCQVPLAGRNGELRLEKEGYLPAWAFVRPRPGFSGEFFVALRPGTVTPGSRPDEVAGFYPPAAGRPPATYGYRKSEALAGYQYALPPHWSELSRTTESVTLGSGGRRATLSFSSLNLKGRLDQVRQGLEAQGWKVIYIENLETQALLRVERPAKGVAGVDRAAVLLEVQTVSGEERLLELSFESPDCGSTFEFTRDLDYLRGSIGSGLLW